MGGHSWYVVVYIFSGFSKVCQKYFSLITSRRTKGKEWAKALGSDNYE